MAYPAIVSYLWNFGDGNTSTLASPSHTYATAGVYTVSLTLTNAIGETNMRTMQIEAKQVLSPVTGVTWNFGDGSSGSGVSTSHLYMTKGWYRVTCKVHNTLGEEATQTIFFRLDQNVLASAEWSFGDGRTGTGQFVDHVYFPGSYVPSIILKDVYGNESDRTYGPTITVSSFRLTINPSTGKAPLLVSCSI